jgi:hypothetical protein
MLAVISRFAAGCRAMWEWLCVAWGWLSKAFISPRFAKIISDFLAEVGVLVFVFPGLEIIIRNEPERLYTVIRWSWGITAICLVAAAIIAHIGDVP